MIDSDDRKIVQSIIDEFTREYNVLSKARDDIDDEMAVLEQYIDSLERILSQ